MDTARPLREGLARLRIGRRRLAGLLGGALAGALWRAGPAAAWSDSQGNLVNVKDFGAVGDGAHDDQPWVSAAFGAIAGRGGVLYFPPGTYWFAGNGGRTGPRFDTSNLTIQGAGPASRILLDSDITAISVQGTPREHLKGVVVRDLAIVGARSGSSPGMHFGYVDEVVIRDCQIEAVGADRAGAYGSNGIQLQDCDGAVVTTCRIGACGYNGIELRDARNVTITTTTVEKCGANGILVTGASDGFLVANNRLVGNGRNPDGSGREGRTGVNVSDATAMPNVGVIASNYLDNNGDHGILIICWRGGHADLSDATFKSIVITGNTVVNHRNWANGSAGIQIEQGKNCTVSGNALWNNYQGVNLYNSGDCTVSGNDIKAASRFGILVAGSVRAAISGNLVANSGSIEQGHGIDVRALSSPTTGCTFTGNRVFGSAGQDVNVQEPNVGNVLLGNITSKPILDLNSPGANTYGENVVSDKLGAYPVEAGDRTG